MFKKIITVIICLVILSPIILFEAATFITSYFINSTYTSSAEAVVVDNVKVVSESKTNGKHHRYTGFNPVVEYEYNNTTYTSQLHYSDTEITHPVGTKMTIQVNPDNPEDINSTEASNDLIPMRIGVGIFGLIELTVMIIIIRSINKAKSKSTNNNLY